MTNQVTMAETITPEVHIDVATGQLLIGKLAVAHHIEVGGNPADVYDLRQLLKNGIPETVDFSNQNDRPDRWEHLSPEDFLEYGRWLVDLTEENGVRELPNKVLVRASHLGLGPSRKAITNRFGSLPEFQRMVSANKIRWRDAFADWDELDFIIHLHNVGVEEGRRPDIPMLNRRVAEGRKEPKPNVIRKNIRLDEAYERAGFLFPRAWDRKKYDEWGVLFYMANGKTPTQEVLDILSSQGKGPSSHAVAHEYSGTLPYGESVVHAFNNRHFLKIEDIKEAVCRRELPRELFADAGGTSEIIRRAGRFNIISELFPSLSLMNRARLSFYDAIGSAFVEYLKHRDERIEPWLVEASAFNQLCYPELFPKGGLIQSLRLSAEATAGQP